MVCMLLKQRPYGQLRTKSRVFQHERKCPSNPTKQGSVAEDLLSLSQTQKIIFFFQLSLSMQS